MSLLGLVRHLARVEHHWFRRALEGRTTSPGCTAPRTDPDLDFNGAVGDAGVRRRRLGSRGGARWRTPARSTQRYDDLGGVRRPQGDPSEVRDILVHMIEEYARHCGHADLLRECIDGRTGQ